MDSQITYSVGQSGEKEEEDDEDKYKRLPIYYSVHSDQACPPFGACPAGTYCAGVSG